MINGTDELNSFETFYHFSPMRQTLLNWYDFGKDADVLELNAECGALTGLLCSRCKNVTAFVRDRQTGEILRKRYSNKDNLTICAGSLNEHEFLSKFDYIVDLCGIEQSGKDYSEYVNGLARCLKEDGKLLLAAENRYGIRYFCGAREKYSKLPFYGINQYFGEQGGHLFHKKELERILGQSVLDHYKFYYPLPDHIAPQIIFTDQFSSSVIVAERLNPYNVDQSTLVACERALYQDIIENGVLGFFSNSFLIECGRKDNLCDILYAVCSTDRARENSFATCLRENHVVNKWNLFPEGAGKLEELCRNIRELEKRGIKTIPHELAGGKVSMPYLDAPMLTELLRKEACRDRNALIRLWDRLYALILQSSELNQDMDGEILKKAYIDLVPSNILYKNDEFYVYDQEFAAENCPAKYVLYRGIKYTYMGLQNKNVKVSVEELKKRYGLEDSWDVYEKMEGDFIAHNRQTDLYQQFYEWADSNRWIIAKRGERVGEIVV